MERQLPLISAIICTRNRGDSAVAAVRSILANDHPCFELIVIDQSTNDVTAVALLEFGTDPRFYYLSTSTKGLGRARNIGLRVARAPLIAFTDDDCRVPADWLRLMASNLEREPAVTVLFCNVLAGKHDATAGFIPGYWRTDRILVKTFWAKCRARGIGAGMAVRRDPILAIGGFDETLGAGARFDSAEDADIAVRAIAHGQWVCETHEVAVVHDGFRTWQQGRALAVRDWKGLGAAYLKPLKAGYLGAGVLVLYELIMYCILKPLAPLLYLRRPQGLGRLLYFLYGCALGLVNPIDRRRITYQPIDEQR